MNKLVKGHMIAFGSNRSPCSFLNHSNGGSERIFSESPSAFATSSTYYVGVTNDRKFLLVPSSNAGASIRVYDLDTGLAVVPFPTLGSTARSVGFNKQGTEIVICYNNNTPMVTRFSYPDFVALPNLSPQPMATIHEADYSPNGQLLAFAGTTAPFVQVYDVATATALPISFPNVNNLLYGVKFSPDGQYLALVGTSTNGNQLAIYRVSDWSLVYRPATGLTTRSLSWFPDSQRVVLVTTGNNLSWANINNTRQEFSLPSTYITNSYYIKTLNNSHFAVLTSTGYLVSNLSQELIGMYSDYAGATIYSGYMLPNSKLCYVSGTVKNAANNPVARTLLVFDQATHTQVGRGVSDAVTGAFYIKLLSDDPVWITVAGVGSEQYKISSNIVPILLP